MLLKLLQTWLGMKHEEMARHLRGGRRAGRPKDLPWSTRKKCFGCAWMCVLVITAFFASLVLGGFTCWLAEKYGWVDEEGENTLSTVVACAMGALILMSWIGVYLSVDAGRLPGTRDFWQKTPEEQEKQQRNR